MAAFGGNEFTIESPEETSGRLTNRQYVRLGRAISSPDIESIALGYLNIDDEIIKSLRYEHRGNSEAFNRDILKRWAYRNPGSNQVEVRNGLVMMDYNRFYTGEDGRRLFYAVLSSF